MAPSDPERWRRVEKLFHAALDKPVSERGDFLAEACSRDASLLRELETLLACHGEAADFIERFIERSAWHQLEEGRVALPPGSRLGAYEILGLLSAGGMGEVYRARDTRLDRVVAIKVLPDELSRSPERRARFEREARAAGALNHPNVLAVYDVGTHDSAPYIVSELLEGHTLSARLEGGALPARKALQYALQIAHGLAAAHDKGIVHRDLKPDNVFVTGDGRVKLLDFGIAKLTRPRSRARRGEEHFATRATESGSVLGTVGYMSPEQVRGEEVDHRSDIFSFGVVLYEMLGGERAFQGGNAHETNDAILKEDPPELSATARAIPPGVTGIVRRCLEKRAEERFQSTHDLALALEAVSSGVSDPAARENAALAIPRTAVRRCLEKEPDRRWQSAGDAAAELRRVGAGAADTPAPWPAIGRARWSWGHTVAVGLLLLLMAALGALMRGPGYAPPTSTRIVPFTSDGGWKAGPRLSPDGERVAYEWNGAGRGNWDVYVKALGPGSAPLRLTRHPADDWGPAWSPDGRQIAFVRDGPDGAAIYAVPSTTGDERKIVDLVGPVWMHETFYVPTLSWGSDGELLYAERAREGEPAAVVSLALATLEKRRVTSPPEGTVGDLYPELSPDGRRVAFVRSARLGGGQDVWVQPLSGGEARRLTSEDFQDCHSLSWTDDGREIVFRATPEGRIFRVSASGGEVQLLPGVGPDAGAATLRRGRLVHTQIDGHPADIWRIAGRLDPAAERDAERLIASSLRDADPAYSPDGRHIAFQSRRSGVGNVWISDADGSGAMQRTRFEKPTGGPRWSPDGREIVFESLESGDWDLYVVAAFEGPPRRLTGAPSAELRGSWSRDGRHVYVSSNRGGDWQLWRIDPGGGEPLQVTREGGIYGEESWDGEYLYFTRHEEPSAIWRVPVAGGDEVEVVTEPVHWADWALSASGLYFARISDGVDEQEYSIHFLSFASGDLTELFRTRGSFDHRSLTVSPDERWVLFSRWPFWEAELTLVETEG